MFIFASYDITTIESS